MPSTYIQVTLGHCITVWWSYDLPASPTVTLLLLHCDRVLGCHAITHSVDQALGFHAIRSLTQLTGRWAVMLSAHSLS